MKRTLLAALVAASTLAVASKANAHFLWLVSEPAHRPTQVHLYFAEAAQPDDAALLERVRNPQIVLLDKDGQVRELRSAKAKESIAAKLPGSVTQPAAVLLSHRYGVISRGKSTFLLQYYAKNYLAGPKEWSALATSKHIALDIVPTWKTGRLQLQVNWKQKPVAKAQVKIEGPGIKDVIEGETSAKGTFSTPLTKPGLFSIRVRHVESKAGVLDDKKYGSVRHYSTLALRIPAGSLLQKAAGTKSARIYPDFPEPVTSFGAAIAGDYLYTYGGHMGAAHTYSIKGQSNVLRRLNLDGKSQWETVGSGPRLQGLAMVSWGGKLYRVGGFTAMNKEGEERNLQSQNSVTCFDPTTKKWSKLPPLPEPRSSHDAAVIGSKLYVAGGWSLHGKTDSDWHETAWVMDLAAKSPKWEPLPKPPFQRRALALAAHDGKLYVIGGMQKKGGPTTRVDIYDPSSQKWSQGPNLQGKAIEGFGCSAFDVGGDLYVSTIRGNLQKLSTDGKRWKTVRRLERARFFHRMLPLGQQKLLFVGGASMSVGKFAEVDVVKVE